MNSIRKLTKLQLYRRRYEMFIWPVLLSFVGVLLQFLSMYEQGVMDEGKIYYNFNASYYVIIFGLLLWIILNGNVMNDNFMSIYPGTKESRILSRLISDHVQMIVFILCTIPAYLINGVVINEYFVKGNKREINTAYLWSFKNLLMGILSVVLLAFALYGLLILFCAVSYKFSIIISILIWLMLAAILYYIDWTELKLVILNSTDLYYGDKIINMYLCKLVIWLVCLIFTIILVKTFYRERDIHGLLNGITVCVFIIGTIGFLNIAYERQNFDSDVSVEEEDSYYNYMHGYLNAGDVKVDYGEVSGDEGEITKRYNNATVVLSATEVFPTDQRVDNDDNPSGLNAVWGYSCLELGSGFRYNFESYVLPASKAKSLGIAFDESVLNVETCAKLLIIDEKKISYVDGETVKYLKSEFGKYSYQRGGERKLNIPTLPINNYYGNLGYSGKFDFLNENGFFELLICRDEDYKLYVDTFYRYVQNNEILKLRGENYEG